MARGLGIALAAGTAALALAAGGALARDLGALWAGGYPYSYDGGRTAGGSPIVIEYRLGIAADPKGKACRLDIEGFQTNRTILCSLAGSENEATVRFESYGDGSTVNAYGIREYEVGQGLLALRRAGGKLLTEWLKLSPDETDRFDDPGNFFARTR